MLALRIPTSLTSQAPPLRWCTQLWLHATSGLAGWIAGVANLQLLLQGLLLCSACVADMHAFGKKAAFWQRKMQIFLKLSK